MRLKIGGKIGPVRAGVSVGRSGVGWGAGAGPIGVTGGTGGRSKTSNRSGSSHDNDSSAAEYQAAKNEHPEDSWGALLAYYGPLLLGLTAISTVFFDKPDRYGTMGFRPPIAYWLFLIGSIILTLVGVLIMIADRRYYEKTGEFRPTVFDNRKAETKRHTQSSRSTRTAPKSVGKPGLRGWMGLTPSDDSDLDSLMPSGGSKFRSDADFGNADFLVIQKWVSGHPLANSLIDEDLIAKAIEILLESGIGSTSLLQRKLKIGFARAVRIMDELEGMGVVGPAEGAKPRPILLNSSDLDGME